MTAGHGHQLEPHRGPAVSSPYMRVVVLAVLIPLVLATIAGIVALWPSGDSPTLEAVDRVDGTILAVQECVVVSDPAGETDAPEDTGEQGTGECREAEVRIDEGEDAGSQVWVPLPFGVGAPEFEEGDKIVLGSVPDAPVDSRYEVMEFQRGSSLIVLGVLFAVAVVALSRWKGVAALVGLGISILVLITFLLPALVQGESPLLVAITGASVIMIVTLYLSHGLSVRTSVALIGTLVSLALTGILGTIFTSAAHFTGLADDSIAYLGVAGSDVDVRGLLLAGLVIGSLGVLDDVTVTQSAAVWEIAAADSTSSRSSLFAAGLRIGRDHVAATVNTLVLAYAGASLPLLLLFTISDQGLGVTLGTEIVAQEVVRSLVGSLGIVAAVPVTTALAVVAVRPRKKRGAGRRAVRPERAEA